MFNLNRKRGCAIYNPVTKRYERGEWEEPEPPRLYKHWVAYWDAASKRQKKTGSLRVTRHMNMKIVRGKIVFSIKGYKICTLDKRSQAVIYPAPVTQITLSNHTQFLMGLRIGTTSRSTCITMLYRGHWDRQHYGWIYEVGPFVFDRPIKFNVMLDAVKTKVLPN